MGDPVERVARRVGLPPGSGLLEALRRYSRNEAAYWGHGTAFTPRQLRALWRRDGLPSDPYAPLARRLAGERDLEQRPYADQLALTDLLLQLPERLLMRADRATMRHGVEARVPFLDLTGFAPEPVGELVEAASRGQGHAASLFWTLYVLALWAHHWT